MPFYWANFRSGAWCCTLIDINGVAFVPFSSIESSRCSGQKLCRFYCSKEDSCKRVGNQYVVGIHKFVWGAVKMGNDRRMFIKQAAGLTAACLVGLDSERQLLASSPLMQGGQSGTAPTGWYDRPMRWAQVAFVEDDPGNYDPAFWLDYFKKTHVDAAC